MQNVYVSIDLEMTSPRPEDQQIIEIALVKFRGGKTLESWSSLVNPGVELPYNIQVLTGINPDDLRQSPRIEQLASAITSFVGERPLVAHSVGFDIAALARQNVILNNQTIDTYELASVLLPQMSSYSLAALAEHFSINNPKQHRAAADAIVTRDVFLRLLDIAGELDRLILDEIVRLVAGSGWPLATMFSQIAEQKRSASTGASIWERAAANTGFDQLILGLIAVTKSDLPPLQRAGRSQSVDLSRLRSVFDPSGQLAQTLPNYEERPSQTKMMEAVATTLNDGGQLLAEAGTGTGKSLAYLLPAAEFAAQNSERIVISTNTINLQDQLFQKDIPVVRRLIDRELRISLLKGRTNYLCLHRWQLLRRRPELSLAERIALVKTIIWLLQTETGDLSELNLTEAERPILPSLWASTEHCNINSCAYFRDGTCFLSRARHRAEAAHLILVNHALLLSDIVTEAKLIPSYDYLIIDEAHHLESQATDQFGFSLGERMFDSLLDGITATGERRTGWLVNLPTVLRATGVVVAVERDFNNFAQSASAAVEASRFAAKQLSAGLGRLLRERDTASRGFEPKLRVTPALRSVADWTLCEQQCEELASRLGETHQRLSTIQTALSQLPKKGQPALELLQNQLVDLLVTLVDYQQKITEIVCEPSAERIYWISADSAGNTTLNAAPLHVAPYLDAALFSPRRAVVLTSATLTVAGSFTFIKERLGLPDADELSLSSPFDYGSSTLVYVPTDMAEPETPNYQRNLHETLTRLAISTGGRMLVLFTSHSQLRAAYRAISKPLADSEILALGHGVDGSPRRHLLQAFKTNERVVLLGAASFWEGIDVVGDALSVLVIVRLPFPVPTDPIIAARSELYEDPFQQYSLPQTILRFRQGFGRLIRSATDRGAFVVLDRRIQSRSYGQKFLKSLPACTTKFAPLATLPSTVQNWLARPAYALTARPANQEANVEGDK